MVRGRPLRTASIFVYGTGLSTRASLLRCGRAGCRAAGGARLVQGVGGALLTPGSLAMVESGFRPADRARASGAWSGLGGVAGALGPVVGGVLVAGVLWRAVFVITLPIGIFIVVMAGRHAPETHNPASVRIARLPRRDPGGRWLGRHHLRADRGPGPRRLADGSWSIGDRRRPCSDRVPRRRAAFPNPMMPLSMFSSRQFSAANAVTFVVFGALSGVFFLLVAFLHFSLGYSPSPPEPLATDHRGDAAVLGTPRERLPQRIGPRIPLTVRTARHRTGPAVDDGYRPGRQLPGQRAPGVIFWSRARAWS